MQLDLSVIDGFRAVARDVGNMLYHSPGFRGEGEIHYHNHFQDAVLNSKLPTYAIIDDRLECYCGTHDAQVVFSTIVPDRILGIDIHPPVTFNEHNTSVELEKWLNAGNTTIEVQHKYSTGETVTESLNIASEIALQIRSKVSGGNPATIQAEVETQLSAKLGISYGKETQSSSAEDKTINLTIPKWTSCSLTQKHSISDMKQKIITTCILDAAVTILSANDWRRDFPSLHSLELYMQGGGGGRNEYIDNYFQQRVYAHRTIDTNPLKMTVEQDRIYRNVKTAEANRTDTPIAHK